MTIINNGYIAFASWWMLNCPNKRQISEMGKGDMMWLLNKKLWITKYQRTPICSRCIFSWVICACHLRSVFLLVFNYFAFVVGNGISMLLSNQGGNIQELLAADYSSTEQIVSVVPVDFNGDMRLDLLVCRRLHDVPNSPLHVQIYWALNDSYLSKYFLAFDATLFTQYRGLVWTYTCNWHALDSSWVADMHALLCTCS